MLTNLVQYRAAHAIFVAQILAMPGAQYVELVWKDPYTDREVRTRFDDTNKSAIEAKANLIENVIIDRILAGKFWVPAPGIDIQDSLSAAMNRLRISAKLEGFFDELEPDNLHRQPSATGSGLVGFAGTIRIKGFGLG